MPKFSNSRSISSVMRRMTENGPPPYPDEALEYGVIDDVPPLDRSAPPGCWCPPCHVEAPVSGLPCAEPPWPEARWP